MADNAGPLIPCSVKVTTPVMNQGSRGSLSWELDFDESDLVINVPAHDLTVRVVMVGDNTAQLLRRAADLIDLYRSSVTAETNENAPFGPPLAAVEGTFSTNQRSNDRVSESPDRRAS